MTINSIRAIGKSLYSDVIGTNKLKINFFTTKSKIEKNKRIKMNSILHI